MKTKTLLLGLSLLGTLSMQAQNTSPWVGTPLPEQGGTFYLYQVQHGKWLQNNNRHAQHWTTRAELDVYGFDIEIVAQDGGYRLNPKFGHNQSINGMEDYGYLDTGRPVTIWTIEPTSVDGVNNTYKIHCDNANHYLNASDDGDLDDMGWDEDWQLVSKEERLADMLKATKASPKDATWLIGSYDFANQDERRNDYHWTNADIPESTGGATAFGGDGITHGNMAFECWKFQKFTFSKTLTDMPNGTYEFSVQGFYRDGPETQVGNKHLNGEEVIRAEYFANDASHPLMSICNSGVTEEDLDSYAVPQGGVYIPGNSVPGNALDRASNCFFKGGYWNEPIKVVVSDGTLTIGIRKEVGVHDDWTVFDTFHLTYLGDEIDVDQVKANLQAVIDEVNAYDGEVLPVLAAALATANEVMAGTDAKAISNAAIALREALQANKNYLEAVANAEAFDGEVLNFFANALAAAKAAHDTTDVEELNKVTAALVSATNDVKNVQDTVKFLRATLPLAKNDGVAATALEKAENAIATAANAGEINDALGQLRIARKIAKADKHANVWKGAEPAEGDFYIYNVGLQRFLCGGGDWGAHAYVGFPGVEVTLIATEGGYAIDTHLNNGGDLEFLNYGGYMDTPNRDAWEFVPVDGKSGVYNMARGNGETNQETGQRMLLGYRPGTYGNIDTDMYGEDNEDNQWILVTRAQRDELLATATTSAPQDATYKIQSPNFNQREDVSAWTWDRGTIFGRGGNNPDFAFECWNETDFSLSQTVFDLLPGYYTLTVQGFYRDGDHDNQMRVVAANPDEEPVQAAEFGDFDNSIKLVNILSEVDKAPGMGDRHSVLPLIQEVDEEGNEVFNDDGTPKMIEDQSAERIYLGEFPYNIEQSCNYFQNGLYKNSILSQVLTDGSLFIEVRKDRDGVERDWTVVDNFRLTYWGTERPTDEQQLGIEENVAPVAVSNGKIYNLQGQQVKNATKGLFIINGKKMFRK